GGGSDAQLKAAAPASPSGRLQHTDASIQVRVRDTDSLAAATTRATRIATSLGGYAQSVDYATPQSGGGVSTIELRVPAQNVKAALTRLAALGTLVSQQLSVNDLEQRLQTQSEQIAQLRRRVAALRDALRDTTLPEAQRVLLGIRLAESKRALAQRINSRKGTISAGATARISLVIGTEKAIGPVPHGRGLHLLRARVLVRRAEIPARVPGPPGAQRLHARKLRALRRHAHGDCRPGRREGDGDRGRPRCCTREAGDRRPGDRVQDPIA